MARRQDDVAWSDPALLILGALITGPKHGYAMIQEIEESTGATLGPGTLYGAIPRLESRGLIRRLPGEERRQPYELTAKGSSLLRISSRTPGSDAGPASPRSGLPGAGLPPRPGAQQGTARPALSRTRPSGASVDGLLHGCPRGRCCGGAQRRCAHPVARRPTRHSGAPVVHDASAAAGGGHRHAWGRRLDRARRGLTDGLTGPDAQDRARTRMPHRVGAVHADGGRRVGPRASPPAFPPRRLCGCRLFWPQSWR